MITEKEKSGTTHRIEQSSDDDQIISINNILQKMNQNYHPSQDKFVPGMNLIRSQLSH